MLRPGLVGTASLVAGLILAVPMAIVGFEFLRRGQPILGVAFIGLAVALVWFPEYVRHRLPHPFLALRRRLLGVEPADDGK